MSTNTGSDRDGPGGPAAPEADGLEGADVDSGNDASGPGTTRNPEGPHDPRPIDSDRPTILIVEDDADLRHSLTTWLQQTRNYTVLPARDGEEARQWANQRDLRIDVAVIDLVLPDSFGSQVAFDQAFARPDIKTIYMSGHVKDDAVLAASVKDPDAVFLQKPFELEELGGAIDEALLEEGGDSEE